LIVRRYNQRLYRVGMGILNDDSEVEDAMQVTYINAWENLAKFKFRSSFSTWITRIMINESLLRTRKRKHFLEMKEDTINHYRQSSVQPNAASKLMNAELKKTLEEAIHKLPEKYRSVFILREVENMSVSETKECLAISEINVKVRLNRAKSMLRNILSELYRSEPIFDFHLSRCDRMVESVMSRINSLTCNNIQA
ncbi:MAG TPA: sigma-70 family RNA polymerase sigma factor, partial [Saprospiraceae bacterium]|nr:sigma-70 family RNA polymerase sigma factor [Saprospiraceae bacterium]